MKELVIASKNHGKIREIEQAFAGLPVKVIALSAFGDIPDAIEDGNTFQENARIKAEFYGKLTGKACLADDSGLEVAALEGQPGVYSARYAGENATDADNNAKLLHELEAKQCSNAIARFRCALVFRDCDGTIITCDGSCEGTILSEPRGADGFGYDPLFFVTSLQKSMAEISLVEKNRISHRGIALSKMAKQLAGYL